MNVYTGSNDVFYIGITTVNRNLKEKLEFTSEFWVFLPF